MKEKIVLLDELGNEEEFIILATFGLDDVDYAALLPADDLEGLTYIFRMEMDEDGDMTLVGLDDEDELKEAVEAYEEIQKDSLQ